MSLPSINFLHLIVSEIQPGQTFSRLPPAHPDAMGEDNEDKNYLPQLKEVLSKVGLVKLAPGLRKRVTDTQMLHITQPVALKCGLEDRSQVCYVTESTG